MGDKVPTDICTSRAVSHCDDGIHKAKTDWSRICAIMTRDFINPCIDEGFDQYLDLRTYESDDDNTHVIEKVNMYSKLNNIKPISNKYQ